MKRKKEREREKEGRRGRYREGHRVIVFVTRLSRGFKVISNEPCLALLLLHYRSNYYYGANNV